MSKPLSNNETHKKYIEHKNALSLEEALDEELAVCHIGSYESFDNPYHALMASINYNFDLGKYFGAIDAMSILRDNGILISHELEEKILNGL